MAGFGGFNANNNNNPFAPPQPQGQGPFGTFPPPSAPPGGPFGTSSSNPFGAPPSNNSNSMMQPQGPFGQPTSTPQPQLGGATSSNPFAGAGQTFGNNNFNNTNNNPGFGMGIGSSGPSNSNPFASPTSQSRFAAPSSVAQTNTGPFGSTTNSTSANPFQQTAAAPPVSSPFGQAAPPPSSNPFAGPSASNPFGNSNNMSQRNNNAAPLSSNPFSSSVTAPVAPITFGTANDSSMTNDAAASNPFAQSQATTFGHSSTSDPFGSSSSKGRKSNKPPRSDLPFGNPPQSQATASQNDEEEKKKKLALIQKKKQRLEELRRKKEAEAAAASAGNSSQPATALNPMAASFTPSQLRQSPSNPPAVANPPAADTASLAQRNAARFDQSSANSTTRALLPTDLQAKAGQAVDYAALRSSGGDREDLDQAKSLVGKCPYMCPDEELLRREREGDIQLLEMVQPGTLHPAGWTLRNTAIKRFRRSAADYKLDVPEWVRPPDVLENVCSYLEEWIMERDRQGPDPRFKGDTPQPLDVYQFIWDRTRMVRKDFTLQNFVGTGGQCDARAVRCHERIARWHVMCEHQLSHIPDYVKMQSQQNIQELGQTMKTLNHFYDDALKRSRVEVPDEAGNETRQDLTGFSHGCANETVQGETPRDYDGSEVVNREGPGARLVGKRGIQEFHHGTAEPEMRGLYILLTIDNDRGMEVMRYAANLSRKHPEIFVSKPVQLALRVYKAKKESNFATFFRILRSSSTPYLFACVMFMHVPQMRRLAFQTMSSTYGKRGKEGQGIDDFYRLKDLVHNLCFEDEEEAQAACKHYNITVKETNVKSTSGKLSKMKLIYWRATRFREPKDPDKDTPIPLRPQKMVSTIERKRMGATRLAVCRGDVSGDGAVLRGDASRNAAQSTSFEELRKRQVLALAAMKEQEDAKRKKEEEARQQSVRLEAERKRREEEQARQAKAKEEERLAKERDAAERKAAEERRRRIMEEERLERERKEVEAERLRKEAEERKRKEEEAAERERQLKLEEARQQEQRRKEEEARRREEARLAKLRAEEEARRLERERILEAERKAREAEERRLAKEWNEKIIQSKKRLALKMLKRRLPQRVLVREATEFQLARLWDPPFDAEQFRSELRGTVERKVTELAEPRPKVPVKPRSLLDVINSLKRRSNKPMDLDFECFHRAGVVGPKRLFLIKIAFYMPYTHRDVYDDYLRFCFVVVRNLLEKRLGVGSTTSISGLYGEFRLVFVDGNALESLSEVDGVLVVVPSPEGGIPAYSFDLIKTMIGGFPVADLPRVAAVLTQNPEDPEERHRVQQVLASLPDRAPGFANDALSEESVENALSAAVEEILTLVVTRPLKVVDKFSLQALGMTCVNRVLWSSSILNNGRDGIPLALKHVLLALAEELHNAGQHFCQKENFNWPPHEFLTNGVVPGYFGEGEADLPGDWTKKLLRDSVLPPLREMAFGLEGTLEDIIKRKLLVAAPDDIKDVCFHDFDDMKYRRSLGRALRWRHQNPEPWETVTFVFLPRFEVEKIVDRTCAPFEPSPNDAPIVYNATGSPYNDDEVKRLDMIAVAADTKRSPGMRTDDGTERLDLGKATPREAGLIENEDAREADLVFVNSSSARKRSSPGPLYRPGKRLQRPKTHGMALVPRTILGGHSISSILKDAPAPLDPTDARWKAYWESLPEAATRESRNTLKELEDWKTERAEKKARLQGGSV